MIPTACPRPTEHAPGSGQSPAFTSPTTSSARRNLRQVRRPHRISIASSPIKRRKVAVRHNPLRQHPPQPRQQIHRLHVSRRHASRVLFNQAPSLLKLTTRAEGTSEEGGLEEDMQE